ncbi:NmrA family NAD(P)-binding protein [Actinoallomurus sp. CA-150999]|uniref:NmrA family NAD(P)-binding protein n=1 Tax=Actinoallomurus sp. CA-150999 TaxID=3239887 RepID=UPI003D94AF2F
MTTDPVLVTGATGNQGGAVARALLAAGRPVRALVRDPSSAAALRLAAAGATLVRGDLDDPASLKEPAAGAVAVFSLETADYANLMADFEVQRARNLVAVSREAGIEQIVHSSVSGAGNDDPEAFDEERWGAFPAHYWRSKIEAERVVREAGFRTWTILRPAGFMENLRQPSLWFAGFTSNRLTVVNDLDVARPWIAVQDIGTATLAALADPQRFHEVVLELAGDDLSLRRAVEILNSVRATPIELPSTPEQAVAWGIPPELAKSQRRMDTYPAPARPEMAHALGIETTTFEQWAHEAARSE